MIEQCKYCKNKENINGIIGCVYMDADCQNGEKYEAQIITNADRIRAMSDLELAKEIENAQSGIEIKNPKNIDYFDCILEWLKQPAEESDYDR